MTEVPPSDVVESSRERSRARREAVIIGFLLCAIVAASVGGAWVYSIQNARRNFDARLTGLARAAALLIDPSIHGLIRHPGQIDGPEYRRAVAPLQRMREAIPEIRFLYTIVRDGDDVRIILDAADPGDHDRDGIEDRPGVWELSVSPQIAKQYALGWQGQPPRVAATAEPYRDRWGTFMSGYAPFYDSNGHFAGAVGVDLDASAYVRGLAQARRGLLLGLVPAGLLVIGLAVVAYRLRLSALTAARTLRSTAAAANAAARQDQLTGLANRTAFIHETEAAIERVRNHQQACCAVLFLDFDHFKFINDTLGHAAGDELLRQIASRLRAALQTEAGGDEPGNVVGRFGGDEFVVLINRLEHEGGVAAVTNGLLAALGPPYTLSGSEVRSSASIGVSTCGRRLYDAETMLRHADVAMYQAKQSGRACYVLFDDAMQARLTRRLTLEADLLRVVGTEQLTVVYEPIVELETGRRIAAEATVRWQHPELGEVPRQEFFEIAEESGLIVTVGEWALRDACRQLVEWRHTAPASAPAFVSVNLSRAEMSLGPRLIDRIRGVLAETRLPPQCLQLEIPHRVATDMRGSVAGVLDSLRACGVRLSMDGFGTGTSSLSCLRSHSFDSVKVAQSSMRDVASNRDALALAHATLTLLENLGMSSVVEEVEDPAQLAVLQSLGCRYAQGRLFSEPVPGAQFLAAWTRPASVLGCVDGLQVPV